MEGYSPIVSQKTLEEDLRRLGLKKGDMVYVHTSLKNIGWLEDGPDTLIRAFLEVLGPEGTLAVPTHTLSFPDRGAPPYDPQATPTVLGKFPEAVRRFPGALRSGHASHSSAAIGDGAAFLTREHDRFHALGERSPLYRLSRSGGKTLLLGVDHRSNTAIHLAESLARLPYVKLHYDASWGEETWRVLPDGSVLREKQKEFPGCSEEFVRLEPVFEEKGIQRSGKVGNAQAKLLDTGKMVEAAVDMLQREPIMLLCGDPCCPCCPARWALMKNLK